MKYDPNWTTHASQFGEGEEFTIAERFCVDRFVPIVQPNPHAHGHVEMNFIEHARMRYDFDGQDVWIEPGEFCLFWAGRPHQSIAIEKLSDRDPLLSFCFMPVLNFLRLTSILDVQRSVLLGNFVKVKFRDLSDRCFLRWRQDVESQNRERRECMEAELSSGLRRATIEKAVTEVDLTRQTGGSSRFSNTKMSYIVGMLEYVLQNFAEQTVAFNAAKSVGLNGNYASNLFRASMGMTLKEFVNETRMSTAYRMIVTTDLPLTSIQYEVGYQSASQFYANFRKKFGLRPRQLRSK